MKGVVQSNRKAELDCKAKGFGRTLETLGEK
jgi:hypothetical protein